MSITILNYHDQALVDQINAEAAQRAEAARAAAEASSVSTDSDFAAALDEASKTSTTENLSLTDCSDELNAIFEEAASTFGVSVKLLKSIARAESNFNPNAVSSAGAVGIMQLMPATAASLGVTNSYDARENIMGGAKLISQLLSKYNGNTSLALAAYNAGSGNVDKYGGIPPFTETQNYVKKVLSYMNAEVKENVSDVISNFLASKNVSNDTLDLLVSLLKLVKEETSSSKTADTVPANTTGTIAAAVTDGAHIVDTTGGNSFPNNAATASTGTTSADTSQVPADSTATGTAATDTSGEGTTTDTSADIPATTGDNVLADTSDNGVADTGEGVPTDTTGGTDIPADTTGSADATTDTADSPSTDASADTASDTPDISDADSFPDSSVSETI